MRRPAAPVFPATAKAALLVVGFGIIAVAHAATTVASNSATSFTHHTIAQTTATDTSTRDPELADRGMKKFGDRCNNTQECGFVGSECDAAKKQCLCISDLPITNHIDRCGKEATINETCSFNAQCEATTERTECRDGRCGCRFEMTPLFRSDGIVECIAVQNPTVPTQYVDPAMIGVLVGMALMFIIICVVLRLFSKARWRENRTIFNTPNPRLMNVSLLRDSKLLHQDRRNSRGSMRGPSRQPSMASLRPHSPNSQGSRRGSKGSSNASATSLRSNKSPPEGYASASAATTPMLESVTVEVQQARA